MVRRASGLSAVTHGHGGNRNPIAVLLAAEGTPGSTNVCFCDKSRSAHTDLFTLQSRHAGRITKNCTCIICRRRSTCEPGSHPADTLLVEREATGKQLRRCQRDSEAERGLEDYFLLLELYSDQ